MSMLLKVLGLIAARQTESQFGLAKELNVDQEVLKQVFYDLQRMGYITADDQVCGDDECGECGVCCTKNKGKKETKDTENKTTITRWKLTAKGEMAVRNYTP